MDPLVRVAEVGVPGICKLWPDIYFGMHSIAEKKGNHRKLP